MENNERNCYCIADNKGILKAGIIELLDEMETSGVNELYAKAKEILNREKTEATVKEKMIQYMVERMQEADAGKVRTLFLCATNIL